MEVRNKTTKNKRFKMNKRAAVSLGLILSLALVLAPGCSGKKNTRNLPRQMKPGSAEYELNQGLFYLNNGNFNVAEKRFKKALKKKPDLLQAISGLGIVYLNQRKFKEAVDHFQRVVRINPKYYDAYNYLGVAYTELSEFSLAKENLLRAANAAKYRTPENAFANLAMLEMKQKRMNAALRYIEKGLAENERFAPLYNLKGIVLEEQGEYNQAIKFYRKALSLLTEPEVSYLMNIGRVFIKQGKKAKALDILEQALSKAFAPVLKTQIRQMIKDAEKL